MVAVGYTVKKAGGASTYVRLPLSGARISKRGPVQYIMNRLLQYPEILLRVVDLSDMGDIEVLLKIPEISNWINSYKRSIIKEKQKAFLLPAGWAGTNAVIHHQPEIIGDQYITWTRISFIDDWEAIYTMKARDAEINSLLNTSSYLRLCPDIEPGARITWPQLRGPATGKLREILRRALCICDAIYDIEAQSVIAMELPVMAYRYYPVFEKPMTAQQAYEWFHFCESSARDELQRVICLSKIPMLTRTRQFKFIQLLSLADLLALWTLCYLASESFHEWRSTAFLGDLADIIGKTRAFKHCILSYGSYFLYGHVRGNGARSKHNASLWNPIIHEFTTEDPNEGNRLPPGPLAALNNTLMNRLDVNIQDVDGKALELLAEALGVEQKVFDYPPSRTIWGA